MNKSNELILAHGTLAEIVHIIAQTSDLYDGVTLNLLKRIQRIAAYPLGGNPTVADLDKMRSERDEAIKQRALYGK